ncbi:peroxisome membrane protein [Neoconidiobolus thromboides FSU 785]|nr:peroxisome membrane protein [Neoconidiobolus thromboides FSU 785]
MFERYETFILSNKSQVNAIENGLRTLTYILPGRFSDAELPSEALYSLLNLVGLYHDKILDNSKNNETERDDKNVFNRYTRSLIQTSNLYKQFAYALSLIEYTEVLMEMLYIKRYGQKGKYKLISLIELIKMLLKLALFKLSKNRTLLASAHPERDRMANENENAKATDKGLWEGKRTGYKHKNITSITRESNINGFLISKVLNKDSARKSESLVSKLFSFGKYAEWLYIIRPFIYVCMLHKFGHKSWKPWLLSLGLEIISFQLKEQYNKDVIGEEDLSSLEIEERKRRKYALLYYLLKSPFFALYTKIFMLKFSDFASNRFLISFFAGMLKDYIPLWEKYYFYSSGP